MDERSGSATRPQRSVVAHRPDLAGLQERPLRADDTHVTSTTGPPQLVEGGFLGPTIQRRRREGGFSSSAGLISMAAGLLVMAVLLLFSMNVFSSGTGGATTSQNPSILSRSTAESQIKLCSEGRDSSYGSPPSSAQQAKCVRDLLGEISAGG